MGDKAWNSLLMASATNSNIGTIIREVFYWARQLMRFSLPNTFEVASHIKIPTSVMMMMMMIIIIIIIN